MPAGNRLSVRPASRGHDGLGQFVQARRALPAEDAAGDKGLIRAMGLRRSAASSALSPIPAASTYARGRCGLN